MDVFLISNKSDFIWNQLQNRGIPAVRYRPPLADEEASALGRPGEGIILLELTGDSLSDEGLTGRILASCGDGMRVVCIAGQVSGQVKRFLLGHGVSDLLPLGSRKDHLLYQGAGGPPRHDVGKYRDI